MTRGVQKLLLPGEEMPELLAAFCAPYMCPASMLTIPRLELPTSATGVQVGEPAEFPCRILGKCPTHKCLTRAAPAARVIYTPGKSYSQQQGTWLHQGRKM